MTLALGEKAKTGRGGDRGGRRPIIGKVRSIKMSDEAWTHCVNQSEGAGAYLRRLVEQDRRKK